MDLISPPSCVSIDAPPPPPLSQLKLVAISLQQIENYSRPPSISHPCLHHHHHLHHLLPISLPWVLHLVIQNGGRDASSSHIDRLDLPLHLINMGSSPKAPTSVLCYPLGSTSNPAWVAIPDPLLRKSGHMWWSPPKLPISGKTVGILG